MFGDPRPRCWLRPGAAKRSSIGVGPTSTKTASLSSALCSILIARESGHRVTYTHCPTRSPSNPMTLSESAAFVLNFRLSSSTRSLACAQPVMRSVDATGGSLLLGLSVRPSELTARRRFRRSLARPTVCPTPGPLLPSPVFRSGQSQQHVDLRRLSAPGPHVPLGRARRRACPASCCRPPYMAALLAIRLRGSMRYLDAVAQLGAHAGLEQVLLCMAHAPNSKVGTCMREKRVGWGQGGRGGGRNR